MANELGKGVGIMLTDKGEGHGSYGVSGCVTSAVDAYVLDGGPGGRQDLFVPERMEKGPTA
ncbi:alpha/beta hydrolase [Streptomyces sp. NPDC051020]|uniref:alpha/beta hydrolase n=1 Tax=Streptomyces sp. NPDC051020 TaxID=3155409 RepID=UPI00341B53E1